MTMKNLLIIFCFISMAATCQDKNSQTKDQKENPCDPDIMCTMEFRIIDLKVLNESGEVIILEEFYTEIDGEKIEIPEDVYEASSGSYPVATDGHMKKIKFEGSNVVFIGLKNNEIVVKHTMIIGKDCCHIQLVEGDQEIVLE